MSCLARKSNDVKDSGSKRQVGYCAGAHVTDGRARSVCAIYDALAVVQRFHSSHFPVLVLPAYTASPTDHFIFMIT